MPVLQQVAGERPGAGPVCGRGAEFTSGGWTLGYQNPVNVDFSHPGKNDRHRQCLCGELQRDAAGPSGWIHTGSLLGESHGTD